MHAMTARACTRRAELAYPRNTATPSLPQSRQVCRRKVRLILLTHCRHFAMPSPSRQHFATGASASARHYRTDMTCSMRAQRDIGLRCRDITADTRRPRRPIFGGMLPTDCQCRHAHYLLSPFDAQYFCHHYGEARLLPRQKPLMTAADGDCLAMA